MFKGQHHESRKSLSLLLTLEHAYCKKSQLLRGTFCFTQVQGPNALTTLLHLADDIPPPKKRGGNAFSLHSGEKELCKSSQKLNNQKQGKNWFHFNQSLNQALWGKKSEVFLIMVKLMIDELELYWIRIFLLTFSLLKCIFGAINLSYSL